MRITFLTRAAVVALTFSGIAAHAADLRAGAGKSEIRTFSEMWPIDGFTSQHDPLGVRVLLVDDGFTRTAIVVIDQTSISDGAIARAKSTVKSLASVPEDNTIVVASHTFSAPHVFGGPSGGPGGASRGGLGGGPDNDGPRNGQSGPGGSSGPGGPQTPQSPGTIAFSKSIDNAVEAAVQQAKAAMQPVKIGFAVGASDISVNRDVLTPQGWWLGGDAAGFTDRTLPVVRIDKMDGKPLAVLLNEAVQSSVMDHSVNTDGGKPITADITGAATRFVEQQYGGDTVALFLIGAAGDQAPILQGNRYVAQADGTTRRVDIHEAGFTLVDLLGERLGIEAVAAAETIKTAPESGIHVWRRTLDVNSQAGSRGLPTGPVRSYSYEAGPKVQVPVVLMRIGDIVIVGLQPELAASMGARIKKNSPFPHTMVVTLVDGGAKYMPDAQSYPRFTYEARNSRFAQGAAEAVASGVDDLLKEMEKSSDSK